MLQEEEDPYYEEAMANAERELAEDAEWKRIQQNTFTRWANEHLRQVDKMIDDFNLHKHIQNVFHFNFQSRSKNIIRRARILNQVFRQFCIKQD